MRLQKCQALLDRQEVRDEGGGFGLLLQKAVGWWVGLGGGSVVVHERGVWRSFSIWLRVHNINLPVSTPLSLAPSTCDLLRDNLIRVVANRAPSLLAQHWKLPQVAVGFGQQLCRGRCAPWAALKLERLRHDRHDGMLGPHVVSSRMGGVAAKG